MREFRKRLEDFTAQKADPREVRKLIAEAMASSNDREFNYTTFDALIMMAGASTAFSLKIAKEVLDNCPKEDHKTRLEACAIVQKGTSQMVQLEYYLVRLMTAKGRVQKKAEKAKLLEPEEPLNLPPDFS